MRTSIYDRYKGGQISLIGNLIYSLFALEIISEDDCKVDSAIYAIVRNECLVEALEKNGQFLRAERKQ